MGFKVNSSFLRFLTMGALGVRSVRAELKSRGFEPIELERYCTANKIWTTKVKRLRLPDLLCVKTGLRVEVRAKSDLMIRMSDAPNNPERAWDAGLRREDLVALVGCAEGPDGPVPADEAAYFSVATLRDSVRLSKLGPPKSASEGAERDRTWPSTVPRRPGRVLSLDTDKLVVMLEGDGAPARRQTYRLRDKHAYVKPGERFVGNTTVVAGAPQSRADVNQYLRSRYDPLRDVTAESSVDRYAAVKALRFRSDLHDDAVRALHGLLDTEHEPRVRLEAAGSAAALGSKSGEERIVEILWADGSAAEMSMEAILVLTELKNEFAREQLRVAAGHGRFHGDERRQAAIWGLGKEGLKSYRDLLPFIADDEENAAFHAIAAFGPDTPKDVIDLLVATLAEDDVRRAAAASEALRVIDSLVALKSLVAAANTGVQRDDWLLATIGRLAPDMVRAELRGTGLLERLQPMLLVAQGANWLANEDATNDIGFLLKQVL